MQNFRLCLNVSVVSYKDSERLALWINRPWVCSGSRMFKLKIFCTLRNRCLTCPVYVLFLLVTTMRISPSPVSVAPLTSTHNSRYITWANETLVMFQSKTIESPAIFGCIRKSASDLAVRFHCSAFGNRGRLIHHRCDRQSFGINCTGSVRPESSKSAVSAPLPAFRIQNRRSLDHQERGQLPSTVDALF